MGLLCLRANRKHKCNGCNRWVCGKCSIVYKTVLYCMDCFIQVKADEFNAKWDKLFTIEFTDDKPSVHNDKNINNYYDKNYIHEV
jgi:hypothetical protein